MPFLPQGTTGVASVGSGINLALPYDANLSDMAYRLNLTGEDLIVTNDDFQYEGIQIVHALNHEEWVVARPIFVVPDLHLYKPAIYYS